MTKDANKGPSRSRALLPMLILFGLAAVVVGGICFYWRLGPAPDLAGWGQRGDAMAPFVALLNVGALLAALWSVALQSEELRETRAEMKAQRDEFARAANAQDRLATAQEELAKAQQSANKVAAHALQLQRGQTEALDQHTSLLRHQADATLFASLLQVASERRRHFKEEYSKNPDAPAMLALFREKEARLLKRVEEKLHLAEEEGIAVLMKKGGAL